MDSASPESLECQRLIAASAVEAIDNKLVGLEVVKRDILNKEIDE
jgi:hypothetical protein